MTAVLAQSSARKRSALERSLLDIIRTEARSWPDWLGLQQREAFEWLECHGLTKPRDEGWKNATLSGLLEQSVAFAPERTAANTVVNWPEAQSQGQNSVLWFVNGVVSSEAVGVAGIRWLPLSEAIQREPKVRAHLGAHLRLENGFVAANVAGFSDGWCLIVEPGAVIKHPIELRFLQTGQGSSALALPRLLVIAGASSEVCLIERHLSEAQEPALSSTVTEIVLEPGAKVTHSRWVEHGGKTWAMDATAVDVGEDAQYHAWSATARGRFVRHDLMVRLAGRRSKAVLDGLYYAREGSLVGQYVRVWHEQPEGVTRECYRGVVENEGRGIFDGIIYVGRGAVRTDAQQENRNLLLGPAAIAHTKPHLEIDNDDVVCSHGATVGQLDEQQLFYLRARGIAEDEAREVLTWAFAKELVDRCPDAELRSIAERTLQAGGMGSAQFREEASI